MFFRLIFRHLLPMVCGCIFLMDAAIAQSNSLIRLDLGPFADAAHHWYDIFEKENVIAPKKNQPKYDAGQIAEIGDNILLYQKNNGGWPKNYDIQAILEPAQKDSLRKAKDILNTTFDNGTTWTHVGCLARIYTNTNQQRFKDACLRGLDFIFASRYENGGWPQYYPLKKDYSRYITYNDDVFAGILGLLKRIVDGDGDFLFLRLEEGYTKKVTAAYNKGIDCLLATQIIDAGKPTAWCQQHDDKTLQPAWARTFEPPSICNAESADIVMLMMSIEKPSKQIVDAIQSAVAWFDTSKIIGIRVKTIAAPVDTTKFTISKTDKVVVQDATAPPIWTRYYELGTHRPLFCNRERKIVYSLAEVERERRDGYGWYTNRPQKVLEAYPAWQKKYAPDLNVLHK